MSSSGAVVTWTDPTTVDGTLNVDCAPPSGTTFSITMTTVTCTARDPILDTAVFSDDFHVTVQDTTPPDVSVPGDITPRRRGLAVARVLLRLGI